MATLNTFFFTITSAPTTIKRECIFDVYIGNSD